MSGDKDDEDADTLFVEAPLVPLDEEGSDDGGTGARLCAALPLLCFLRLRIVQIATLVLNSRKLKHCIGTKYVVSMLIFIQGQVEKMVSVYKVQFFIKKIVLQF